MKFGGIFLNIIQFVLYTSCISNAQADAYKHNKK